MITESNTFSISTVIRKPSANVFGISKISQITLPLSFINLFLKYSVWYEESLQEYPVNAGVPQGSFLGLMLPLLYLNELPDHVICNIAIYADNTTLY